LFDDQYKLIGLAGSRSSERRAGFRDNAPIIGDTAAGNAELHLA